MSRLVAGDRQVAESCFEFLHLEMVDYFLHQARATAGGKKGDKGDDEAVMKQTSEKLVGVGFSVGQRLAERYTKDSAIFAEQIDMIKFICKEFWIAVFKKQIDKLQTDYKGVYVLHCRTFRWLARFSQADKEANVGRIQLYTSFATGILQGALSNLGMRCTVEASVSEVPQCKFTIRDEDRKKT